MLSRKDLLTVVMIPVIISLMFVVITPIYEKSIEEPAITVQTFANLLKEQDVKKFNEYRNMYNGEISFVGLHLENKTLSGVDFSFVKFTNTDFEGIDLNQANLPYAILTDANLNHSDLTHVFALGTDLTNTTFWFADLSDAFLGQVILTDADMRGVDLSDADLGCAILVNVDLRAATLSNADFGGADLSDADLSDALFGTCTKDEYFEVQNLPISKEEAVSRGAIYEECHE